MIDDRKSGEGDVVHAGNEAIYRRAFSINTGHSGTCIRDTVADMATLLNKVCDAYGGIPVEEILEKMTVEQFDHCLRKILASKECDCKK
jgi:hypothetical protein